MNAPPEFRIALAQIAPKLGDLASNLELHRRQIAAARAQQADLIVFPELSLTGYFLRDMVPDVSLAADADELRGLIDAAEDAALVAGFVEESSDRRFFNSALFAERGQLLHIHRKVYLPTYGLFEEQRYFAAGERIRAFDSARFGRVGLLVCEDLWHLSAAAILQAEGIDLLICIANSPARGVDGEKIRTAEVYDRMAKMYAQLIGAIVVVVNRVGFEDGLCFWGGSQAVGPEGNTLAQAPPFDEALTIASFDPAELRRQRLITPLTRDEKLLLTIEELERIKCERYAE
ncbi:MAG TPA: nitrilase-related carbon-nitrogen hydrolase [Pirellulales bacterium]|jgi:predicted amidohydrolase|nr:nitrilase-related carbon-nitrogen hydrolase [Pirellulales bacterium]